MPAIQLRHKEELQRESTLFRSRWTLQVNDGRLLSVPSFFPSPFFFSFLLPPKLSHCHQPLQEDRFRGRSGSIHRIRKKKSLDGTEDPNDAEFVTRSVEVCSLSFLNYFNLFCFKF